MDIVNVIKKNVDEQESCEQWLNGLMSKQFRKRIISEQCAEMINKLNVIEQILKGDVNVNEL